MLCKCYLFSTDTELNMCFMVQIMMFITKYIASELFRKNDASCKLVYSPDVFIDWTLGLATEVMSPRIYLHFVTFTVKV